MPAKYSVCLSEEQRQSLDRLTRTGTRPARAIQHARMLLLADEDPACGPAWTDEKIADALGCGTATVARIRRRFVKEGLDEALRVRKNVHGRPPKIDGVAEAHLIALACSDPPVGRARWTVRLLADRFVSLGLEEGWLKGPVSRETIRLTLKKTGSSRTA
jgi:hypothetical protein